MLRKLSQIMVATVLLLTGQMALAETVHLAVASNFLVPARDIAREFERKSGYQVLISAGSTGKLAAQIRHGAPYDVFLAADTATPEQLVADGFAREEVSGVYARGRLVLVSALPQEAGECEAVLQSEDLRHLAVASPALAPYGRAAQQTLDALTLSSVLQSKLVRGENVAQTMHFFVTGNAQAAFVAKAQLAGLSEQPECIWQVPDDFHDPVDQGYVLLNGSGPGAAQLTTFLMSPQIQARIQELGYELVD